jgi:hypothetical protein
LEHDYHAVKRAIDRGRCKMAIVVPPDFSQDLAMTNSASVQAILDATDDNTATIALGYAHAVVGAFSANVQVERTQSLGQPVALAYQSDEPLSRCHPRHVPQRGGPQRALAADAGAGRARRRTPDDKRSEVRKSLD